MRHLLLLLLPAAMLAQAARTDYVGETTTHLVARTDYVGERTTPLIAVLLAQDINAEPVTGTTTLVIRGGGQNHGSLVWLSNDGKPYTQGPSGHLIPYHAPVTITKPPRWTYAAYGAAVGADYLSTRYALSHGATDAMYRCNPHRAGCMNQAAFWAVAAIPVGMWLLNDLWLHKRTSPQWQRFANLGRKLVIGGRFGVAAYNLGIGQGIKGGRNGK